MYAMVKLAGTVRATIRKRGSYGTLPGRYRVRPSRKRKGDALDLDAVSVAPLAPHQPIRFIIPLERIRFGIEDHLALGE